MKQFFILLGLSICLMSLSAQEAYQYNQFYYQRSTLFEKLPIDSDDIVFLGNSITNGCEWHELFNNPNIKNRGISSDVSMGVYDRLDPIIKGKPAKIFLMIGINDIAHHLSTDSIVKNITQIILPHDFTYKVCYPRTTLSNDSKRLWEKRPKLLK